MNRNHLEERARALAFAAPDRKRAHRLELERDAERAGIYLGTIAPIYAGMARGAYSGFTVPAVNIRGLVFDLARSAFEAARATSAGPFMFEIAPAELVAGAQSFDEYAGEVLAAALAEGWRGPIFLQGDHFQMESDTPAELERLHGLFAEAANAGFYQIDIDAGELGAADSPEGRRGELETRAAAAHAAGSAAGHGAAQGGAGARRDAIATARVIRIVRGLAPHGAHLLLGGEVGEIGGELTTEQDLSAFLSAVASLLGPGLAGLGKVSVNTGTRHGGLVDENGNVGRMPVDFELVARLSRIARERFALPGVVQHGASTMSIDQMARLPACGVNEVHLATAIQTTVFEHPAFPKALLERMQRELAEGDRAAGGPESGRTASAPNASVLREHGWRAWGRYKQELWGLPEEVRSELRAATGAWFQTVFGALGLAGKEAITREVAPESRVGGAT